MNNLVDLLWIIPLSGAIGATVATIICFIFYNRK